jgi:hypothetical protein
VIWVRRPRSVDGGSRFLGNASTYIPNYAASNPRNPHLKYSLLHEKIKSQGTEMIHFNV